TLCTSRARAHRGRRARAGSRRRTLVARTTARVGAVSGSCRAAECTLAAVGLVRVPGLSPRAAGDLRAVPRMDDRRIPPGPVAPLARRDAQRRRALERVRVLLRAAATARVESVCRVGVRGGILLWTRGGCPSRAGSRDLRAPVWRHGGGVAVLADSIRRRRVAARRPRSPFGRAHGDRPISRRAPPRGTRGRVRGAAALRRTRCIRRAWT